MGPSGAARRRRSSDSSAATGVTLIGRGSASSVTAPVRAIPRAGANQRLVGYLRAVAESPSAPRMAKPRFNIRLKRPTARIESKPGNFSKKKRYGNSKSVTESAHFQCVPSEKTTPTAPIKRAAKAAKRSRRSTPRNDRTAIPPTSAATAGIKPGKTRLSLVGVGNFRLSALNHRSLFEGEA